MQRMLFVVFAILSLPACAQAPQPARVEPAAAAPAIGSAPAVAAGSADARAIAAVRALNRAADIEKVGPAPLPGFREALVQGQVVYVSDDGEYLFLPGTGGALFNIKAQRNLTQDSIAAVRRELIKTIPASERIVFAPADPKYTVTVFTDAECGYCRKLHSEIAEYNRHGIAVEYVAFPRMGIGSEDYRKMVSVWCAADRRKALTDIKAGRNLPAATCKNPVEQHYRIGERIGVGTFGTPSVLNADGVQLGGYLPPAQLREALDKLAAQAAVPPANPAPAAAAGDR
ncbi:DsbC family protein [Lysobacter enzymogenes]|uniref:DsbC family protein n=1 Tax=Lysobacter enzymogenes TaxID=69 RepID=UPI001A962D31|nr:DsbC family protein [Lysobacter enzymogenes]QQP98578.1 DsbC family protein [Lysobacter enzymogenes]